MQKSLKRKEKREARAKRQRETAELGEEVAPRKQPRTLDNTREADETVVKADDVEVTKDEEEDEFAPYFLHGKKPKIMITTQNKASSPTYQFIKDLIDTLPNAYYYKRGMFELKKICKWAAKKKFTHLIILNEKAKKLNAMYISHLPYGPTAMFKLSSSMLGVNIPGHGRVSNHIPEIILNGFTTRLGHRVGRLLGSMFPHDPEFRGRRVVTFHNQRDFIFIRQHRYMFTEDFKGAKLQELGPRFTLKPRWIQAGTFNTKEGDYEWVHKRHEMDTTRRRFHL